MTMNAAKMVQTAADLAEGIKLAQQLSELLIEQGRNAVADERQRCIDLCNHAREEGEGDMRQIRNWIQAGHTAEELKADG